MPTGRTSTVNAGAPSPDTVLHSVNYLLGKLTRAARHVEGSERLGQGSLTSKRFVLNASISLAALIKHDSVLGDTVLDDWLRESGCPFVVGFTCVSISPPSHEELRKMELYLADDHSSQPATIFQGYPAYVNPLNGSRVSIHLDELPLTSLTAGTTEVVVEGKQAEILKLPLILFLLADRVMRGDTGDDGVHHWYSIWTMTIVHHYWSLTTPDEGDRQADWGNAIQAVSSERLRSFFREASGHFGDSTIVEELVSKVVETLHEATTDHIDLLWEMIEKACLAVHDLASLHPHSQGFPSSSAPGASAHTMRPLRSLSKGSNRKYEVVSRRGVV